MLTAVAAAALLTGGLAAQATAATQADRIKPPKTAKAGKHDKLGSHDRELLATARTKGEQTVTVMFVTNKSEANRARKDVVALGGTVRYAADKLGYFSADVPTSKVEKAAALDSVVAADLDEVVPLPDVEVKGTAAAATAAGPGQTTPDDNPYMPTNETGAVAFKSSHRAWDGRDVTIGILDSGIDLAHPALQKTSTGQRKIVDWFTATAPSEGDGTWRAMLTAVTPTNGTFTASGLTWKSPNGTFKFNRFTESTTNVAGGEVLGDVNRDGDTTDRWGILYDETNHNIIVDQDQDQDFTNNPVMRPYREGFQVGTFGNDNPATEVVEAMPFTVDYREDVSLAPLRAARHLGLRRHRDRLGRARLARGRHHRGERHVRRPDGRRRTRRPAGLRPRLHLRPGLHRGCADRRHGRARREPARRHHQHVHRRPARPQRREQRPRRAVQPDRQRPRRADRAVGRQLRQRAEHDR